VSAHALKIHRNKHHGAAAVRRRQKQFRGSIPVTPRLPDDPIDLPDDPFDVDDDDED